MTTFSEPAQSLQGRRGTVSARRLVSWPTLFVLAYIACQIALLFVGSTSLRVPTRIGAFATSLVLLTFARPLYNHHPGTKFVPLILLTLLPGTVAGGTSGFVAGLASAAIYLATLAPLIWVSHRPVSRTLFLRLVTLLWVYNVASAAMGVLQTYYPGRFDSELSSVVRSQGRAYIGSLTIVLADGTRAFRPMGLTDLPGGAATGGLNAIFLGIGLMFSGRSRLLKTSAILGMAVGVCVILLSHVRMSLVMAGVGVLVVIATGVRRGDLGRASFLAALCVAIAVIAGGWAFALGGQETIARLATLTDNAPVDVYSKNRGLFLQDAFSKQLFDYPIGAGAGRWGMINVYFGDRARSLYAEIMWSAWIYDGGVPMLVAYCALIVQACAIAWRVATHGADSMLSTWGAVVLSYDIAAIAATFVSPNFGSQTAMELWFLNACLFSVWRQGSPKTDGAVVLR